MKTISKILALCFMFPFVSAAQRISDMTETLTISTNWLFMVTVPGVTNYKATFATLTEELQGALPFGILITNENHFGATPVLTIKGGALLTNLNVRAAQGAASTALSVDTNVLVVKSGMVGIQIASPTNAFDVNGSASVRGNLYLPGLPTNGSPLSFLALDAGGEVFETAAATGTGSPGSGGSVYLDAAFGNDATATRTNAGFPYLTPSNAVAAIQSGDTLYVRSGTYIVNPKVGTGPASSALAITNKSNFSIVGEGGAVWQMGSRYFTNGGTSASGLIFVNCSNFVVKRLALRGFATNGVVYQDAAIILRNCANFTIEDCIIDDWQNQGISTLGQATTDCINGTIKNCILSDIGGINEIGLALDGTAISVLCSNLNILNNTFLRNTRDIETWEQGVVKHLVIEGNTSEKCRSQSILFIGDPHTLSDVQIINNSFYGYPTNGVGVRPGWLDIRSASNVVIRGNTVVGFHIGIGYGYSTTVGNSVFTDAKIEDNTFIDMAPIGIQIMRDGRTNATLERISIKRNRFKTLEYFAIGINANNSQVEDNEIVDGALLGHASGNIMIGHTDGGVTTTNGTNITVVGNRIYTSGTGVYASHGIVVTPSGFHTVVWGNEVSTNYASALNDSGVETLTQPLNKIAAGKLLRSDNNSRLAEVTIGTNIIFDGTTLSSSGSGGGGGSNFVVAAFGNATVTNTITAGTFNASTANFSTINLTNGFIGVPLTGTNLVSPGAPSAIGAILWTDGTSIIATIWNGSGTITTNKLSMTAWP